MNKYLRYINLTVLPALSLAFLYLINLVLISNNSKMMISILMVIGFAAFCLAWLLQARLIKNDKVQMAIGLAWLFIFIMAFAYTYLGKQTDEVAVFVRQYQDYLLIWIGIIAGYEISDYLSARKAAQ